MEEGNLLSINQMAAVLNGTPGGLAVYQYDGERISPLFHNPAFYEIMGYTPENIKSIQRETTFLGVHSEDVGRLRELTEELLIRDGVLDHTYRVWNDKRGEYRWIRQEGSVKTDGDGMKRLYCIYSDVSSQRQMEAELTAASAKIQDIINAIPGGVAIYKVTDRFETVYFSDGVPGLSGYTVEEYRELVKQDAVEMTYRDDRDMVASNAMAVIESRGMREFEFRKQHRDGHIVWVNAHVKWIGEEDGCPLIHCVFHNISALKEAQLEMDCLINSIPGGIASYKQEDGRFVPVFFSNGAMALTGHTREELQKLAGHNFFDMLYEMDKDRVIKACQDAFGSGEVLDISYRVRHKDGSLVWIHLNGRRMGQLSETARFYAVFNGMSAETRLYQNMVNETADGIYVIDRDNYDLLYANEAGGLGLKNSEQGIKCYKALFNNDKPCRFCTLKSHKADGTEHEMKVEGSDRFYTTWFLELDWNGIPSYVKYVRDVTEEFRIRREKELLEGYFRTVVKQLPGGISVISIGADGVRTPEFISDGLADMLHMTAEQVETLYANDMLAGIYPQDIQESRERLEKYIELGQGHYELTGRIKRGDGGYIWVKILLSLQKDMDGERRLYSVFTDISKNIEEKERLRSQYEELIRQHHRKPGPDVLVTGHCDITSNLILEITDYTDSALLQSFGEERETFFQGVAGLIVDDRERQTFLSMYLNGPLLAAYGKKETEQVLIAFVRLPRDMMGRYVQFKVNLVEAPDTGNITGVLTVTDVTEKTISDRILSQLSQRGNDSVLDLDLMKGAYKVLAGNKNASYRINSKGYLMDRIDFMVQAAIVPRDREQYAKGLNPVEIRRRLESEDSYTFSYSITDENGDIRTKNINISTIDRRLERACAVCTDITDSVREQQGLLNMIAYTFELAGFINISGGRFTMYTRRAVLESLPPIILENYSGSVDRFTDQYILYEGSGTSHRQFCIETMLRRLEEEPGGYDFVVSRQSKEGLCYKQINILWGDQDHRTICMVRADVTDMLTRERQAKKALEEALKLAEEASLAKSDFLSAMSHDIRTPMNAIMGMTTLAALHLDEREKVADYLQKISVASRHLLSLINDVLDMSRIERSKITLNSMETSLSELVKQISDMIEPQAKGAGGGVDIRKLQNSPV